MTIVDVSKATNFLHLHGQRGRGQVQAPIFHMNRLVSCSQSNKPVDSFLVRSLASEEKQKWAVVSKSGTPKANVKRTPRTYRVKQLRCGQWDYHGDDLVFQEYYGVKVPGDVTFTSVGLLITLDKMDQIEISYRSIDSYTTGSENDPSLTFSLKEPPKFYKKISELVSRMILL